MTKFIAGFLTVLMITCTLPAAGYALNQDAGSAGEHELRSLTYEQAVEMAIEYSYELKNRSERTKQLEALKEESLAAMDFTRPQTDVSWLVDMQEKRQLLNLVQTEIDLAMSRKMEDLGKESIAYQVRNAFDEIMGLEEQLKLNDFLLSNLEQRLKLTEVRVEKGLDSAFKLNEARSSYLEQEHLGETLEKSRQNAYLKLGTLLGVSDIEEYTIEEELSFEVMEPVNLDVHVTRSVRSDPYIWLQEQQIDKAEKGLWLYTYTGVEEPYRVREGSVRIAKNELAEMKNDLQETIRTRYNQIRQLEERHAALEAGLSRAEESLRVARLQHQLGMVIEMDVKEARLAVASIEHEMNEVALQHRSLVILLNKPYLAPEYV